ncbi:MAG: DUF177 domain-containing protein [Thermoleophilia bacterium]|jgi:uncharacterized protein|nr:DUF177 domain-containing protein [Thermoleophilia bacterium]
MAPPRASSVDLARLALRPGAAARVDLAVPVEGLQLGGQAYRPDPPHPEVRLDVSRSGSGLHMRLRFGVDLVGPCQRCLEDARVGVRVDAREFQAAGREGVDEPDEDLDSAYLSGPRRQELDVAGWARDALADDLPMAVLCREDCAGLCPRCGVDLAGDPGHDCATDEPDPRWDALGELARRLRDDPP